MAVTTPGIASRSSLFAREAWKNMCAAPLLSIVAVLTIAVSLILVGLFALVTVNADHVLDAMTRDLRITVYLTDAVTPEQVDALQKEIAARPEVTFTNFLTAREDRGRNRELLPPELLDGLDAEAIPGQAAIEVGLEPRHRTKDDFAKITEWLEGLAETDAVQELFFGADKIRILFAIIDVLRVIGSIICAIVLAAAVFFTFSTIKLAVYARREEIEVLRLAGATSLFIRAPFVIEGAVAGILGSFSALTIVGLIHARLVSFVEEEHFLNISLDLLPMEMVLWFMIGGVLLGMLGSLLSVGRYLR